MCPECGGIAPAHTSTEKPHVGCGKEICSLYQHTRKRTSSTKAIQIDLLSELEENFDSPRNRIERREDPMLHESKVQTYLRFTLLQISSGRKNKTKNVLPDC